jgi:hypothetical protein
MKGLVLVTLPVTVAFWMLMQLTLPAVLSEATVPDVMLIAQGAATARGTPPMISAAADDDASSSPDRRASRRGNEMLTGDVGNKERLSRELAGRAG